MGEETLGLNTQAGREEDEYLAKLEAYCLEMKNFCEEKLAEEEVVSDKIKENIKKFSRQLSSDLGIPEITGDNFN